MWSAATVWRAIPAWDRCSADSGATSSADRERIDLAISKVFPVHKLGELAGVEFRAEAFKVFNNPIFSNPQANISNSNFGTIISTVDSTGRILQLALKVNF